MAEDRIFTTDEVEALIEHDEAGYEDCRPPAGETLEKLLN